MSRPASVALRLGAGLGQLISVSAHVEDVATHANSYRRLQIRTYFQDRALENFWPVAAWNHTASEISNKAVSIVTWKPARIGGSD